ncbi:hypothetical protein B0H17DRAFT_1204979 [Mycena rosella]|uniref:Uncharacterized protein n=1 Tax=Mycena rosella TaxID=1033263 RepID=A0AAD7D8G9_MYCRO|nr:hypothetical protein B0H17DRAFT_1204979 [Mycena rosella]
MDLPERAVTNRACAVDSQLQAIVETRLRSARDGRPADAQNVLDSDALPLPSKKASSISGDTRHILDICRFDRRMVVSRDVNEMTKQNRRTAASRLQLPPVIHQRVILVSLIASSARGDETDICTSFGSIVVRCLISINLRIPTPSELGPIPESLVASQALLMKGGAAALRKAEEDTKVVFNMEAPVHSPAFRCPAPHPKAEEPAMKKMDPVFVLTPPAEADEEREGEFGPLEMQQIESRKELEEARAAAAQTEGGRDSTDEPFLVVQKQADRPGTPESLLSTEYAESLNTRVDTLEISFDVLTKRVDSLWRMLENMRVEVHGMEGEVDALDSMRWRRRSVS